MCVLLLTLKIKIDHSSTSTRFMATTLGRLVNEVERPQPAKLRDPVITWLHDATNKKRYISTFPRLMTAKLGKVEIYSKRPPSIKST